MLFVAGSGHILIALGLLLLSNQNGLYVVLDNGDNYS
jgi:hypothetical protein